MTRDVALIADIGGTHARFALILPDGQLAHVEVIAGNTFDTMADVCRHYLDMLPQTYSITCAAWAVAGPMIDGRQIITNRNWSFTAAEMQHAFGWDHLLIINDFAAQALALPHLTDADKREVKSGHADASAPVGVVGPGTGLGVAGLVPLPSGDWHVLPGEGGHVTLPASNATEAAIIAQLQTRFTPVIAEHVLSGKGLLNLYQAMAVLAGSDPDRYDAPRALADAALAGQDDLAVAALHQFCDFLGSVAGNAALTLGARGGVYLAGGILPQMADFLCASGFAAAFAAKGVVAPYLDRIPVWLVTHPFPAFVGLKFLLQKNGMVKTD